MNCGRDVLRRPPLLTDRVPSFLASSPDLAPAAPTVILTVCVCTCPSELFTSNVTSSDR